MDKSFWNGVFAKGREYRKINVVLLDMMLAKISHGQQPGTCLDIGCGAGDLAAKLAEKGYAVTGADISDVALEKARALVEEKEISGKVRFVQFDAVRDDYATLPFQPFDLITCKDTIAFFNDLEIFFSSLKKVLKEDGHLLVITSIRRKGCLYDERERTISVDPEELIAVARKSFPSFSMVHEDFCEENLSTGIFMS